jgi:hypothetical protein
MVLSAVIGRGKMRVPYDWRAIIRFVLLAGVIFVALSLPGWCGGSLTPWVQMLGGTILLACYAGLAYKEVRRVRS